MDDVVNGVEEAFIGADMDSWATMMKGQAETEVVGRTLDPAVYAACFNTPAGREVLSDMYARFVNVTIVEPGRDQVTHGIRQGQANVVFDIIDQINQPDKGTEK